MTVYLFINKLKFVPGDPTLYTTSFQQSTHNLSKLYDALFRYTIDKKKTHTNYDDTSSIHKLLQVVIDILDCCEAAYPEFDINGKNDRNTQEIIRNVYDQAFKEQKLLLTRIEVLKKQQT